ncbi:homoserine acetyltransferase [Fomitiporia mediterranea MF3/22]|uniref:homoserine acetyltransferase n=1 Tax=Fomitiporia mediterranea (strain MF3/22) TaxID=694068 RepID=UPI0004408523|nr:homoserine acetyltransferase [Fomitiporia mediterranea MF3/22]EJD01563.1 homoserine acetyltransferase [Fomitiporia mediterranea MF3/22]
MQNVQRGLRRFLLSGPSKTHVSSLVGKFNAARAGRRWYPAGASSTVPSRPSFPCVDAHAARESRILQSSSLRSSEKDVDPSTSGPEPAYSRPRPTEYLTYHHDKSFPVIYSDTALPEFDIAYETWGRLSPARDNVILLHTGLSASSHAASNALNPSEGWWEKFIGPGKALDTNEFFIICTNVLGGCYGSTGPSSIDPRTGTYYGTHFPILSIFDMVKAQFALLDHLGIDKLYASAGCSMGGMQSLATAWLHPERVGKLVSISGTARTSPSSVAMRFAQRSVLMSDPNWKNGFYYDSLPPHVGMKLARQIATITYRSGPEWDLRFGRQVRVSSPDSEYPSCAPVQDADLNVNSSPVSSSGRRPRTPMLCPDFLIETYLDHQGEQFCLKYDANSLIYISKAMDLFDMTESALLELGLVPSSPPTPSSSSQTQQQIPTEFTTTSPRTRSHSRSHPPPPNPPPHLSDLAAGLQPLSHTPTLILGVQSDILFPVEQQREVADALRMSGNGDVRYYELGGVWGHDTFLLDVQNVGGAMRGFLS